MTIKFKGALAALAASTVLTVPAMAQEFRIDRLFVVGDSLSDLGAYSNTFRQGTAAAIANLEANGQPVPDALIEARDNNIRYQFTNNLPDGSSLNYSEVVADRLGIEIEPNLIVGQPATSGTSFAQGGSRVATENTDPNLLGIGVLQTPASAQVDSLLTANPSFDSNDLVIYWVGANDISTNAEEVAAAAQAAGVQAALAGGTAQDIQNAADAASLTASAEAGQAVATAATLAVGQVEELIAAGATNLVVVTIPDIGTSTPVGQASGDAGVALLSGLTHTYNDILTSGVAGRATVVDAGAVLNDVLNDADRYGFSDLTRAEHLELANTQCVTSSAVQCIDGATTRPGVAIFADDRHLTNQANLVLGEMAFSALTAIGQAGAIPVATISGLRQQSIGLEQRLNLGAFFINDETGTRVRRPVGNVEVYGGVELGFFESEAQQVVPGFDATTQVVKAAADIMVTENVLVGVGGSIDHGQVDFDGDRGGFDSRLFVGGVFGVAQIVPGVYANGFLGGGIIESVDIDRSFTTGDLAGNIVSRNSYDAETDGTYFIARTNLGAVLPVGNGFFVNPSVGFAYEKVDIEGYNESARNGAPASLAARVGDLEYEGYRGTAALAGFYRPPSAPTWTFGLRGSWEHDFNDDDVQVPFAVGDAPTNVQVAPRPDDSYGLLSATIVKELSHSTSMNLQASTNFAQNGVDGYTLGLGLKHSF